MRLFIGIPISNESKKKIKEIQETYLQNYKVVDLDNLHITLAFLGDVGEDKLNDIIEIINSINIPKIKIHIENIINMKSLVIGKVNYSNVLIQYQLELANKLRRNGFEIENRKYFPHITISRKVFENINLKTSIHEYATSVVLYESILTSKKANYIEKYKKHI